MSNATRAHASDAPVASTVRITVDGSQVDVDARSSVAVALLSAGFAEFRLSQTGTPRAPVCGMGVCFECRVTIDGVRHQRSCLVAVREGMAILTGAGAAEAP